MSVEYPLPVSRLTTEQACALVCPRCHFTRPATEDEIGLCEGLPSCTECSPPWPEDPPPAQDYKTWSWLEWKYEEGETCPNCGDVGFRGGPHCSRACALQTEYAAQLAERAA